MNAAAPILLAAGCALFSLAVALGLAAVLAGRHLDRRRRDIVEHGRIQDESESGGER